MTPAVQPGAPKPWSGSPALRVLWILAVLPLWGCALGSADRCGAFRTQGSLPCDETFAYGSVVRIASGRDRDGVYRTRNTGSGILAGECGLILTAAHVVSNPERVAVLHDETGLYEARPVPGLTFPELDLAFLQVSGLGRRVIHGCVLHPGPVSRRFPPGAFRTSSGNPAEGAAVQVVGYPYNRPRVLSGRIVDPRYRLVRYARESGLNPQSYEELVSEGAAIRPVGRWTDRARVHIEGMHTLIRSIRQGCVFVELDSSRGYDGISGGPVVLDGEVIGIVTASWDSFERTILIATPVSRTFLREAAGTLLRPAAPSDSAP